MSTFKKANPIWVPESDFMTIRDLSRNQNRNCKELRNDFRYCSFIRLAFIQLFRIFSPSNPTYDLIIIGYQF
jgi:hypothetical protein